ncbi:hypothetical protein ABPG77_003268 [Micractinium sp. CCAP 211/92]
MFAARRDNVRELFGGKPLAAAAQGATPEKLRQQEYAAQLREQIATREAARQKEKAHSLRQSAALLELRQAAPVLPGAGAGAPYRNGQVAAREVAERKRAQYKAELERQVQEKAEQRRQEQAAEQAAVVRKAAEAEQLRLRAASGTYGGGSGPLRDTAGRPITDLNQVRHWQVAALLPKPEVQPVPGHQTPHLAARPAHWATAPAAAADAGWHDGPPAGATLPPLQRQPSRLGSWQHAGSSAGVQTQPPPAQQLQRQLVEGHGGLLDPPRLQGGVPSGPRGSLQQPQSGLLQGQGLPAAQLAAQIGPTSWNGSPAAPQPEQSANLDSGAADPAMPSPSGQPSDAPSLQSMGVNDGAPLMRLRSDRSFQTPSEAERRAKAQAEFQAALRAQMEEKARQKADERRRRREEEAAEEARLERERERMRAQFDADQAKQKAKHAGKQAGGAETLESGGISIKFKPPPAGRPGPQQAQQQHATKPAAPAEATAASGGQGAVHHDDAVPGVESRVKGPPPRRQSSLDGAASSSSQQQEQGAPMQRQPQPSGDCLEACTAAGVAPQHQQLDGLPQGHGSSEPAPHQPCVLSIRDSIQDSR